jgi:hypothetical protein
VSPLNITTSHYLQLHDQLDRIEQSITSFDMADQQGQDGKGEQDDAGNIAQRFPRTHPDTLSGKASDRSGAKDGGVAGNVSTVTAAVNHEIEHRLEQVAQARAGMNPAASSSLGQGASQVFTPHIKGYPTPWVIF